MSINLQATDVSHDVDILARTVPSGVLGNDLRVTVALRPVKVAGQGAAQLETWPADIEAGIVRGPAKLELRFPSLVPDENPATPNACAAVLQDLPLSAWPNRSEVVTALKIWHEVIPASDVGWDCIHADLETRQELDQPEPEAHTPVCVSGRQGEMVLLAKMLRAIETAQVALSDRPVKRSAELAMIAWRSAKRFLDDHKGDLEGIYLPTDPKKDGKDDKFEEKPDPISNIRQTKLKRAYARKALARVKAACAASRDVGAKCVQGSPQEAAGALIAATLERLADGMVCLVKGTDVAADRKVDALYRRLFELRQFFLLAAALDSGALAALESSEKNGGEKAGKDIAKEAANPAVERSQRAINLKDAPARTRLSSLEETPDLGRLFRFFVDFRLPVEDLLPELLKQEPTPDGGVLALVRLTGASLSKTLQDEELSRWTLAKFRLDRKNSKILSFLPASREELVLAQSKCDPAQARALLHQLDGVYMLGGDAVGADPAPTSGLAAMTLPAYELVSADLRGAAREIDSRADRLLSAVASSGEVAAAEGIQTSKSGLRSGGLSVVSFSAAPRISRMIGTSQAMQGRACGENFLDADDLSMGRLPMFGIRTRKTPSEPYAHQWFVQTRKRVRFLERRVNGKAVDVDRLIGQLYPGDVSHNGPRSLAQASADRTVPRVFNLADKGDKDDIIVASVDAAEMSFLGDPMGVETGLESGEHTLNERSNDLLMDRQVSLFDIGDGEDAAVLPARFGMSVIAAFVPIFLGGAVLTPGEAAERFAALPESTVPRRRVDAVPEGRRYLRSEPVASPQILIPKGEADAAVEAYRGGAGPDFSPQTTGQVVLRTTIAPDGKPDTTAVIAEPIIRIVMPPIINLELAEKHGVFDDARPRCFPGKGGAYPVDAVANVPLFPMAYHKPGTAQRPRDGLRNIHIDAGFGGYPLLRYDIGSAADRPAIVSAAFDDGRAWLDRARAWARAMENDPLRAGPPPASPVGDAVFAPIGSKTVDQGRTIPFYPDPMASRLVIRFRAGGELLDREALGRIDIPLIDPRSWPDVTPVALVITADGDKKPLFEYNDGRLNVSGIACRKLVVNLRRGLVGTLDMWAVPAKDQLAQWSELVDTAASLDCFPDIKGSFIPSLSGCGILGSDAPDGALLETVAARLYQELLVHPLPELAEPRGIELVHATTRPVQRVALGDGDPRLRLALRRTAVGAVCEGLGDQLLPALPAHMPAAWASEAPTPALEVDLGGYVSVDLASTSSVEVMVRAVAPSGGGFDDLAHARSRQNVNAGRVEPILDPRDGKPRPPADIDIYGFRVSAHGKVELPKSEQLWARFSNLPQSLAGVDPNTPAWLSLHSLFGGPKGDIVASISPLFGDTKARRVELKFNALARHAGAFVKRPRIQSGRRVVGEPLAPAATALVQQEWSEHIWLPASARPGTPVAAAQAHPLIGEGEVSAASASAVTKNSLCEVRLWLQRPWFTSGEKELLGIVLWPRLSRIVGRRSLHGLWRTSTLYERPSLGVSDPSPRHEDYMVLNRFEDRFLTGAARFVTRWGSDATEAFPPTGWKDWVVPYEIFRDFDFDLKAGTASSRRRDAAFVPKVAMPIPDVSKTSDIVGSASRKRQRYLNVDLLAYEPRFDIDREQWYVDIRLDPGEMISPFLRLGVVRYQEHAPRDLQVSLPGEPFEFQLLTKRQTHLEIKPEAADPSRLRLEITVSGPATRDDSSLPGRLIDATVETHMVCRVQGLHRVTGLPVLSSQLEVAASGDGAWKEWRATFIVPRKAATNPDLDVSIHVEEMALRPPTDYSKAFFETARDEAGARNAGRRYACTIAVPRQTSH